MRQYIGARYVPRFTGLYDNTQSYEALDVVDNGSGTSYIAKKPTPANTPLTDTDYWFLYGSTNGAIINLQDQIDDMKDGTVPGSLQAQINGTNTDVANLPISFFKNKNVVIYGDSLSIMPDAQNMWYYLKQLEPTVNITNRAVNGENIKHAYNHIHTDNDLTDFNIIILEYNMNTWSTSDDMTVMCNAYETVIAEIYSQNAEILPIMVLPYYANISSYGTTQRDSNGLTISDYNMCTSYIAASYGIPVLDLSLISGVNKHNSTNNNILVPDVGGTYHLHPQPVLAQRIGEYLYHYSPSAYHNRNRVFILAETGSRGIIFTISEDGLVYFYCIGTPTKSFVESSTLPIGLRPPTLMGFAAVESGAGNHAFLTINTDGTMVWSGTSGIYACTGFYHITGLPQFVY